MPRRALLAACLAAWWSFAAAAERPELIVGPGVSYAEAAVARSLLQVFAADDAACLIGLTDFWRAEGHARDFVERHERPEIREAGVWDAGAGLLLLDIRGRATVSGATRRVVPIPGPWLVRVDRQGLLVSAETEVQVAARELVEAPDDTARRVLLAERADLHELALAIGLSQWRRPGAAEALALLLEASRAAADAPAEAECLRLQALIERASPRGRLLAAQSLEVARRAGDADAEARALFSLGMVLSIGGHDDDAVAHLAAVRPTLERSDDPRPALKALLMAMHIELRRGRRGASLPRAREAHALARRFGWRDGEVAALLNMQSLHTGLRQHDIAASLGREAYRLAVAYGLRTHAAMAAANLAEDEIGRRDFAEASAHTQRAIALTSFVGGERAAIFMTQARIHLARHRPAEAEEAARMAEQLGKVSGDTQLWSDALVRLATVVLTRGGAEEALQLADRAVELNRSAPTAGTGYTGFLPSAAHGIRGRALLALGREAEGVEALRTAVAIIEEERSAAASDEVGRAAYFEDKLEPYRQLVAVLADGGRPAEAFQVAQLMKGRILWELVHEGRVDISRAMSDAERAREQELEERLMRANLLALAAHGGGARIEAERDLDAARLELRRFRSELHAVHASTRTPSGPARVHAPRDAAVVDYVVTPSRVIAFIVTATRNGSPRVRVAVSRIGEADLRMRIDSATRRLRDGDARYASDARGLYRLLLAPLPDDVLAKKTLCIVPDGVLWQVPFHALVAPDGRYVIERTAVFYAPSAAMLHAAARRPGPPDVELLAFANPVVGRIPSDGRTLFGDMNLRSLPEAESEVMALRRLYGRSRSRVYIGAEARESLLKQEAGRSRVLHIATHGFADPEAPMFSALLLAPADGDDGVLEAWEIAELELRADLAVLSACETARGAIMAGEGVIGLAWAFLAAGVPTTVVSQWKASSRATEALMVEFHRALVRGDGHAAAMRKAQLALLKDERYRAPFYWAAFGVVGAGRAGARPAVDRQ